MKNLRLALTYFVNRGHSEIVIFLHGKRQPLCEVEFSSDELKKYFTFTSFRRLDNGKEPQVADDDRWAKRNYLLIVC